jgi:hypothetical protein
VRSEFNDGEGSYIPSSWDAKHLLTVTTTKDLKRNWRIGARWRFVGGLPYTPWDIEKSSLVEAWNLQGGPYADYSRLNAERFDPFHQLDIRVDKSYYFEKLTAKFYIDIQNFYNFQAQQNDIIVRAEDASGNFILADNGNRYVLNEIKNTSGTVLPTIGIIIEF